MTAEVDVVIIGAGVVGLAAARAFALAGHEVLILEREEQFGTWTSSRNSEVIHAGLYYGTGTLKAQLCVRGCDLLYPFCADRGVPHDNIGKLIFAHSADQTGELDRIEQASAAAGATGLRRLSGKEANRIEPALHCAEALFSSRTGIIDSHAYMYALLGEAEHNGATLACHSHVTHVDRRDGKWQIHVAGHDGAAVTSTILINSAGLAAHDVARLIDALPSDKIPPSYFARGVYFSYGGRLPFSHLIYPVPEPGGLGTHLTLDLAGQGKFGPDVEWINGIDYSVDPSRHGKFLAAARRIWPEIDGAKLQPAYAGIRPKLSGPGQGNADFVVSGPSDHGLTGLVNLFGIESPGLTASLALGELLVSLIDQAP